VHDDAEPLVEVKLTSMLTLRPFCVTVSVSKMRIGPFGELRQLVPCAVRPPRYLPAMFCSSNVWRTICLVTFTPPTE
jgi:hypothetical protein